MRKNDRYIRKINGDIIDVHGVAVLQADAPAAPHSCADAAVAGVKNHRQPSFGNDFIKSALIDKAAVNQRLFDTLAVYVCLLQEIVDLRRLEHTLLNEKIGDLLAVHDNYLAI